ncbi:MAG: YfhO family protein [Ruminococcus sp.]|nr:YfhO family protein [Ruminococcus sp.]
MTSSKLDTANHKAKISCLFCNMSDKKKTALYFLIYTLCFSLIILLIFWKYIISGKTLIWNLDGMTQHYLVYIYIGEWLREIFNNIFIEHSFVIPMWDINIGAGSDIITTFNYYGLGDPLCLLTAFFNKHNAYYIYDILIIVRLYLSGVFFSCYCFRMKQRGVGVFLGTFAYLFCGYSLFSSVRHPFFILPMMFLPLMLMGAERILSNESPVLFIMSVFMSLAINFYFAYMVIILTIIYVAVRFFTSKCEELLKTLLKTVGRFMLYGIIGVVMSAILLLPVLLVFLNSSRTELSNETLILYDPLYYLRVYSGYCGYVNAGSWTVTGFVPLTLISALLLFRKKGEYTYLKILFGIFTIFLLIPIAGKFLNGFSYIANRWVWGYALLLSFITAVMFNHLSELTKRDKIFLCTTTAVYFITSYIIQKRLFSKSNTSVIVQLLILLATVGVIVLAGLILKKNGKRIIAFCTAVLCFLSIGVNAYYVHYSDTNDYFSEFVSKENATALLENSVTNIMSDEMQNEFYRYEQIPNRTVRNQSIIDNSHGVSFYWSLTNDNVSNYLHETEAVTFASHDFLNFDRKTFIDELFSVKYFFAPEGTTPAPYGYEYNRTLNTHQGNYDVYINKYPLPLGYGYSDYITRDRYETLTAAQKQEVLLSNILLESDHDSYSKNIFELTSKSLEATNECGEGVTIENNRFIVTKNNAEVTLNFDTVKNCELYLDFRNLHCEDELWTSDIKKMNGEWESLDTDY